MQQYYMQKLEMQILQKDTHSGLEILMNNQDQLNECLYKHYTFPSDNRNILNKFISTDFEMEKIILNLPDMISKELTYEKITLDFMKETDSNEIILEIRIYSKLDEKTLPIKEDIIIDKIIDKYPKTLIDYIILVEPMN